MSTRRAAPLPLPADSPVRTEVEAAAYLRLTPHTLKLLRVSGKGPRFHYAGKNARPGEAVRYLVDDLLSWLRGRARLSTSDRTREDPGTAASSPH